MYECIQLYTNAFFCQDTNVYRLWTITAFHPQIISFSEKTLLTFLFILLY